MNNFQTLDFDGQRITAEYIYTEMEVNFTIKNEKGYLFRLVPSDTLEFNFDISPLDKCLNVPIDWNLFYKVSKAICNYHL